MNIIRNHSEKIVFAALILLLTVSAASAGTFSLQWDPNTDGDLAGYRVYYGSTVGTYDQNVDVGNVTSYTLTGLTDCATWYVAVKAYDTEGLESVNFSNEVSGWARPVVSASTPNTGQQGADYALTITGSNFQSGASVEFLEPGITVTSVTVNSCTDLTAQISIAPTASLGATDVEVINADLVFGVGSALLTVIEPQIPANITSHPVPQIVNEGATASFSVSADGTAPLAYQWKRNGTDITGATSSDYTTPPTTGADDGSLFWCTVSNAAGSEDSNTALLTVVVESIPVVVSEAPANNATGVARSVQPVVVFSEAMNSATISSTTVQLLDSSGSPVAQAAGSPVLAGDGVTVTITLAADLEWSSRYKIRVSGGASGVHDLEGTPMDADFTQPDGFETEANAAPQQVSNVQRSDVKTAP
jgi:hypothetical protein